MMKIAMYTGKSETTDKLIDVKIFFDVMYDSTVVLSDNL